MNYTTPTSVANYMDIPVMNLPDNIDILIREASYLMDYITLNYIQDYYVDQDTQLFSDSTIEQRVEDATNAQIHYWTEINDSIDIIGGNISSFNIGNFSVTYNKSKNGITQPILAPRARRALLLAGLLYRGIGR